jgi:myosin heavy subunit
MELETDDLAALPDLNEESLLVYLKARYKHDIIYVKTNALKYQTN